MTIEKRIKELLVNNGLSSNHADQVISAMKADDVNKAMLDRWDDDVDVYPQQIIVMAWVSARQHALEWIDANLPLAWFRPLFADKKE